MTNQLAVLDNFDKDKIKSLLPASVSAEVFIEKAKQGILTSQMKDKLLAADQQTLFNAVCKAAQAGINIDNHEGVLIPYGDQVNFIPMYHGLVNVAVNSGAAKKIYAEVVYSNDEFKYQSNSDQLPEHTVDWFGDRGEPKGAFAVAVTEDEPYVAILTKEKIMAVAADTRNKEKYQVGKGHWQEWWKKTAIRNLIKQLPNKPIELSVAESADNDQFKFKKEIASNAGAINAKLEVRKDIEELKKEIASVNDRESLVALYQSVSDHERDALFDVFTAKSEELKSK